MSTLITITPPAGSDNKVPIYNPEGRFTIYAMKELWDNTVGDKRFVPNVGDLVVDNENKTISPWWVVTSLDADFIPTLEPWGKTNTSIINQEDILTGPGRSTHNNTYRLYIDKSVTPYVLAVDNRLSLKGTVSRFAKILVQDTSPLDSKVISAFYDNSGNLLSQSIPLELVQTDAATKKSEYAVPVCYTMEDLKDGEIVTVAAYTEGGHAVSLTQLTVENTSWIRHRNQATRYVTGIELISPFMSETDPNLIQLPINVPLQGLYLKGRVLYSDGSSREYPVDGVRFALLGMESYLATMVNQKIPVVLRYTPNEGEVVYGATSSDTKFVTETYQIKTMEAKGAYNVRLYCYPEWVGSLNGYHLRWFLHSSERNARYDVTEHVDYTVNTPGFQSKLYGVNQVISVSVNLKDVNPLYENFRHAQVVQLVLWRDGTERSSSNWTIVFESGQNPAYGVDTHGVLQFINHNFYKINLGMGCATKEAWLEKLYAPMKPIFDQLREVEPPKPTHFRVRVGNSEVLEKPIEQYNLTYSILNGLTVNGNAYIEWIRKTPETDLELGTSGVILWDNGNTPL